MKFTALATFWGPGLIAECLAEVENLELGIIILRKKRLSTRPDMDMASAFGFQKWVGNAGDWERDYGDPANRKSVTVDLA